MNMTNAAALDLDYTTYKRTKYFSCLNGMRCASISYVIWHHTNVFNDIPYFPMFSRGFLGVDLFFIISGFLIMTLLLREQEKTHELSLKNFYVRRFLRIFPVYYTLLLGITLVLLLIKPNANMRNAFFTDLPFYATYTSNWHHNATFMGISWSLSTEEQFYIFWPPILKFFTRKTTYWILALFLAINQFVNLGFLSLIFGEKAASFESLEIVQCTFTPIILGVLLALLLDSRRSFQFCYLFLGKTLSPLFILIGFLIAVNIPGESISGLIRLTIQFFGTLLIGALVVHEKNIFQKILTFPLIERIGIVSYSMYLLHLIVRMPVKTLLSHLSFLSWGSLFVGTLLLTYLVCELSFRYYETPFLNLKKKFT